eukprot:g26574.t1
MLWAEGPAWNGVGRYLVWSDIPNNVQMRWLNDDGHVSVMRHPSNNSNGNTFDKLGRQISFEHGTRMVARYEYDGTRTVLASKFEGKSLNAPNDGVVHPNGDIWFTDPGYGGLMNYEGRRASTGSPQPYQKEAVYRIDMKTGKLHKLTEEIFKPNGLCFSPDYKKVYVADTGSSHYKNAEKQIKVWDVVDEKTVRNGRTFASMKMTMIRKKEQIVNGTTRISNHEEVVAGQADGIRCDEDGNIWSSAGWVGDGYDGVHIFAAEDGKRIGQIKLPEIYQIDLDTEWLESMNACLESAECVSRELTNGKLLVVAPTCPDDPIPAVAVGIVNPQITVLAEKLAKAAFDHEEDSQTMEVLETDVVQFAEQFTANLEELSWLRQLASKLVCSRVTQDLNELAAQTLPPLRTILDAEVIVLALPDPRRTNQPGHEPSFLFPVWDCEGEPDTELWGQFLSYAAEFAKQRAYVVNAQCSFRSGDEPNAVKQFCPQIESAVLTEIADGKKTFGWLLALNKGQAAMKAPAALDKPERLGQDEFGTHEATLLESGARMLAAHASNVSLFNEQRDLVVSVVRAMINVIDARDPYTCGHSDRVAVTSKLLAGKLGLSMKDQEAIYLSGLLHDIGKVGVPDDVLLKPGRLTEEEFRQIKEHPERGVQILEHLKQLQHVLPGVLHHHEAYDGSGYPHGLAGEDIPLMARIMAVSDAYDAMTTNRPYRDARTPEEAVMILHRGAGKQWDPDIVAAFLDAIDEMQEAARQYALAAWAVCLVQPIGNSPADDSNADSRPSKPLQRWLGPQKWVRDTDGPALARGKRGAFDDTHIFAPCVIREDRRYRMWYSGSRGTVAKRVFSLGLAESKDGKSFSRYAATPVFQFGDGKHSILTATLLRKPDGSALRENGKLRMWFSSTHFAGGTGVHTLHESTSSDGVNWSKPSESQLPGLYAPTILRERNRYRMWFTDVSKSTWVISHAESPDGKNWKVTDRGVINLSQQWERSRLFYPAVLKIDGVYLMWYGSYWSAERNKTALGFAVSEDGIRWHKHPDNPVLRPDPKRPWESHYTTSQSVIRAADGSFRIWYASRTKPPFVNKYFAIGTAKWKGP